MGRRKIQVSNSKKQETTGTSNKLMNKKKQTKKAGIGEDRITDEDMDDQTAYEGKSGGIKSSGSKLSKKGWNSKKVIARIEEETERRSSRSAKVQAMKKMLTMKEKSVSSDGEDNEEADDISLESESGDDDFEPSSLPGRRPRGNTRLSLPKTNTSSAKHQKACDVGDGSDWKNGVTAKRRYAYTASQESFLSISESDSSDEEEVQTRESDVKRKSTERAKSMFDDAQQDSPINSKVGTQSCELKPKKLFHDNGHDDRKDDDDVGVSDLGYVVKAEVTSRYFTNSTSHYSCEEELAQSLLSGLDEVIKHKQAEPSIDSISTTVPTKSTLSDVGSGDSDGDFENTSPVFGQGSVKRTAVKRGEAESKRFGVKSKGSQSSLKQDGSCRDGKTVTKKRKRVSSTAPVIKEGGERVPSSRRSNRKERKTNLIDCDDTKKEPAKKRKLAVKVGKLSEEKVDRIKRQRGMKGVKKMETDALMITAVNDGDVVMSSDDSDSEWEEVEDTPLNEAGEPTVVPREESSQDKSLEIDIDLPGTSLGGKKKKRDYSWATYFQWQLNKYNKEKQLDIHKTHLVLLLASCFHSNRMCNREELHCLALSIIPLDLLSRMPKSLDSHYITKLVKWFGGAVVISSDIKEQLETPLDHVLPLRFEQKKVASERELVHMFVIILRALGADVRIIFSLQPLTFKAKLLTKKFKEEHANAKVRLPIKKRPPDAKTDEKATEPSPPSAKSTSGHPKSVAGKHLSTTKNSRAGGNTSRTSTAETQAKIKRTKAQSVGGTENNTATPRRSLRPKNKSERKTASKVTPGDSDDDLVGTNIDEEEDSDYMEELMKSSSKRRRKTEASKRTSRKKKKINTSVSSLEELMSSDSDFEVKVISVTKQPRRASSQGSSSKKKKAGSRKVLSSDSEGSVVTLDTKSPTPEGSDCWIEVYLPDDSKWICVDCARSKVNKPQLCETFATKPVTYVVGVENDGSVKDVTRRYASKWLTQTHKLRPDEEWWEGTLRPYLGKKDRDKKEESALQSDLVNKPLPTSVGEYKNHPLYALRRHLLKFEAIYPESAAILGYCRRESVYSRECVHTLHTRDTWMKDGRAIQIGEKPYKMVKPRPKWKKNQGIIVTEEATLGIFGHWQTEVYIPPPAVDGKVPRNEYGNVELFKPSMLPGGTVHLKIQGLNKVARKLDIDCAPAMMGWDFHAGFNHPVMDGFVVCEEFEDVLLAAWEEEKAENERKEKEKRETRVYKRWKLLIKSLLIGERLKERYRGGDHKAGSSGATEDGGTKGKEVATPVKASWPVNRMTSFTGDAGNLLPFEKKARGRKR